MSKIQQYTSEYTPDKLKERIDLYIKNSYESYPSDVTVEEIDEVTSALNAIYNGTTNSLLVFADFVNSADDSNEPFDIFRKGLHDYCYLLIRCSVTKSYREMIQLHIKEIFSDQDCQLLQSRLIDCFQNCTIQEFHNIIVALVYKIHLLDSKSFIQGLYASLSDTVHNYGYYHVGVDKTDDLLKELREEIAPYVN